MKTASRVSSPPRALSGFLLLPLILSALFFAMPPANVTAEAASLAAFTGVAAAAAYLETAPGGSADAPVPLPVNINLADTGGNGWLALLSAIKRARKYVALDLSASTISGMTATAGEFDPDADDTDERYVVSLVLPDGATGVKAGSDYNRATFRYFTALKSVAGAGVTSVGINAFSGCAALTTASFPKATSIGINAFSGCTGLTSLSFPKAISIGAAAFRSCTALTSLSFPKAASVGINAFSGCTGLTAASLSAATDIGEWAFSDCTKLSTVSLPNAASVGDGAFSKCTGLTSVSLPAATSIGDFAFSGCTGLGSVSLPAGLTSIGTNPFAGCVNLSAITVDSGNTAYKAESGRLLSKGGKILIAYPSAAGALTLDGITSVGKYAFSDCTKLSTVSLPNAASVGDGAFSKCTGLTSVSLLKATSIGAWAFSGCTGLGSVSLPAGLTSIGNNPFAGCVNLSAITVDSGNAAYKAENGRLLSKDGKTLIAYPSAAGRVTLNGITSIGAAAFSGCTGLTSVSLPEATSIGAAAFRSCTGLETVSFPQATSVGNYAFAATGTRALAVTLGDAVPALGAWMFHNVGFKPVTVRVPSGAEAWTGKTGSFIRYNTADKWGNGFRGGGWNGGGVMRNANINSDIHLTVTTY